MGTILWIGLASTTEVFEKLAKKGYFHAPAHVAQRNIIDGIESNTGNVVNSLNGFMMPSFPKCSELVTPAMVWEHTKGAEDISVLSVNIPYVDFAVREFLMVKKAKQWAKNHMKDKRIDIIVYAASQPYIKAALAIRKIIPTAKICLIVPDLPLYMELSGSRFKQFVKEKMWKQLHKIILQCDSYVLFTKYMAEYLNIQNKKWMVMEGSVRVSEHNKKVVTNDKKEKVVIMYSGALGMKYGIPELLDAFSGIKDEKYELWFTGSGDAESLIEERQRKDSRIKLYGFLPSREDVLVLQQQATMLVNTRMPTEKASAYCFPSKIFEYMLSGKPVLSFVIPGIPKEYYNYLQSIEQVDAKAIREAIIKIGDMSQLERDEIGNAAREFVRQNKNNVIQAKKICDFLKLGQDEGDKHAF